MNPESFLRLRLVGARFKGHSVPLAFLKDIGAQVDDLRLVEDGWLEGGGRAPAGTGLDWLLDVFDQHYPGDAPLPHLYPTEAGGVQAEWSLGSREVTLEVDLETHDGEWHVLDMQSGELQERVLDCGSDEDWSWLVEQIAALNQGQPGRAATR